MALLAIVAWTIGAILAWMIGLNVAHAQNIAGSASDVGTAQQQEIYAERQRLRGEERELCRGIDAGDR